MLGEEEDGAAEEGGAEGEVLLGFIAQPYRHSCR